MKNLLGNVLPQGARAVAPPPPLIAGVGDES
jgi:hypothetical protein